MNGCVHRTYVSPPLFARSGRTVLFTCCPLLFVALHNSQFPTFVSTHKVDLERSQYCYLTKTIQYCTSQNGSFSSSFPSALSIISYLMFLSVPSSGNSANANTALVATFSAESQPSWGGSGGAAAISGGGCPSKSTQVKHGLHELYINSTSGLVTSLWNTSVLLLYSVLLLCYASFYRYVTRHFT